MTDLGLKGLVQIVTSHSPVNVTVPEKKNILFLRFPPDLLVKGTRKIDAQALDAKTEEVLNTKEVTLLGPTH